MYIGVFDGYPRAERKIPTSLGVKGQYPLDLCSPESMSFIFQYAVFSLKVQKKINTYKRCWYYR